MGKQTVREQIVNLWGWVKFAVVVGHENRKYIRNERKRQAECSAWEELGIAESQIEELGEELQLLASQRDAFRNDVQRAAGKLAEIYHWAEKHNPKPSTPETRAQHVVRLKEIETRIGPARAFENLMRGIEPQIHGPEYINEVGAAWAAWDNARDLHVKTLLQMKLAEYVAGLLEHAQAQSSAIDLLMADLRGARANREGAIEQCRETASILQASEVETSETAAVRVMASLTEALTFKAQIVSFAASLRAEGGTSEERRGFNEGSMALTLVANRLDHILEKVGVHPVNCERGARGECETCHQRDLKEKA